MITQATDSREIAQGRYLTPPERAAAIRKLEMEFLGFAELARLETTLEDAIDADRRRTMKFNEWDLARQADAELRGQGR